MAVGWHVRMRLKDEISLADTEPNQRLVARTVLTRWKALQLLTFRSSGPHLDLLSICDRRAAGEEARMTEMTLVKRLGLPAGFLPANISPAKDQWHLTNLFRLILRGGNEEVDPFHEASNLPDLLGMRVVGVHTATTVRSHLPRVKRAELVEHLGMPGLGEDRFSVDHLATSTAAAAGLTCLQGRGDETVAALVALANVADQFLTAEQIAAITQRSPRTIRRLRRRLGDNALQRAIRLQMCIRRFKGERHLT